MRKTPKAALKESPSLRNTFKPITQKSPKLMSKLTVLLRMQFRMEGQESTSRTQEVEKTKSAWLQAYAPQTTKLKQKPWKQQQPTLKSALMLLTVLSSLLMPCPPCRPLSQIGTLTMMTYLLLLPPSAEAMQSPYSGFLPTAMCLAMRLLTLSGKGMHNKGASGQVCQLSWGEDHPQGQASGGRSTQGTTRLTPATC